MDDKYKLIFIPGEVLIAKRDGERPRRYLKDFIIFKDAEGNLL